MESRRVSVLLLALMFCVASAAKGASDVISPVGTWKTVDDKTGKPRSVVRIYEEDGRLAGVMGFQSVRDVDLIRHAYVRPGSQRRGVGGTLVRHLRGLSTRRILVGTWGAADWAVRFYRRHGFELVSPERKSVLLKTYWIIPDRQIEISVVLANPPDDKA